jgi:hypothetical protein
MSKSGSVRPQSFVKGYEYYIGMHMIACHAPVSALKMIKVGQHVAWEGNLTSSGTLEIREPNLFSGPAIYEDVNYEYDPDNPFESTTMQSASTSSDSTSSEGGISGDVDVEFGDANQGANAYLVEQLGADYVSGHRGVLGFVLKQVYVGNSPYIKPWAFLIENTNFRHEWYPAKKSIFAQTVNDLDFYDINPAHLILECLTNPIWGMGYNFEDVDEDSFIACADTLYEEQFGLSFLWDKGGEIERLITEVLRHIDAALFVDIKTGKFVLKLIRVDYDVETLPVIGPDQIIEVQSYDKRLQTELINTINLTYLDSFADKQISLTLHHIALMQQQGGMVSKDVDMNGISNSRVANKVIHRELKSYSTEVSTITIACNRECSSYNVGDVFKFSHPDYGIEVEVMRIVSMDFGSLKEGQIVIQAIQDFESLQATVYSESPPTLWQDPVSEPVPVEDQIILEAPYWVIARSLGDRILDELEADFQGTNGYLAVGAVKPVSDAYYYVLSTRPEGEENYTNYGTFNFVPYATLGEAVQKEETTLPISYFSADVYRVSLNTFAVLSGEVIKVEGATTNPTPQLFVSRGVLDTVPQAHSSGEHIYFLEQFIATDYQEYTLGEEVFVKARTVTSKGVLSLDEALESSVIIDDRYIRPYAPGNFRFNGESYPTFLGFGSDLVITWAHRDRLQQTAYIVTQEEDSIGPEVGTTYTLEFYDETDILVRTQSGLTGTTYTYTRANETADAGLVDRLNIKLTVRLFSVRDGYESWQYHEHTMYRHARFIGLSAYSDSYGNKLNWVAEVE